MTGAETTELLKVVETDVLLLPPPPPPILIPPITPLLRRLVLRRLYIFLV